MNKFVKQYALPFLATVLLTTIFCFLRIHLNDEMLILNHNNVWLEQISDGSGTYKQIGREELVDNKKILISNEIANKSYTELIEEDKNLPEIQIYLNNENIDSIEAKDFNTIVVVVPVPDNSQPTQALELLRGVAQAQLENNNESDKQPLKVVIADDDRDPKIAKQVASAIVIHSDPKILGVLGHSTSKATLEAAKVYGDNLAVISATSTSVDLSKKRHIFRTVPDDDFFAEKLAEHFNNKLVNEELDESGDDLAEQHLAVFYDYTDSYSRSFKSAFVAKIKLLRGQDENIFYGNLADSNFDYVSKLAKYNGVKAFLLLPSSELLNKAFDIVERGRKEFGKNLILLGGDVMYDPKTLVYGKDAVDMVIAIPWDDKGEENFPCESESQDTNKSCIWGAAEVNWRTTMAYDATKALIEAIENVADVSDKRTKVCEQLESSRFEGVTGSISFDSNGDRNEEPIELVKVYLKDESKNDYDFAPID